MATASDVKHEKVQFFAVFRILPATRPLITITLAIVGEQILAVSTHLTRSKSVGKQGRYPSVKVSNKPETADIF